MESEGNSGNDLPPVAPELSGEGLPYAPENFPNPGDIWRWKAGKRISTNGNYRDRYLYLPPRLAGGGFKSKLAVERYVKEFFPHVNILDFFASFSWTIPSGFPGNMNPVPAPTGGLLRHLELKEEQPESDSNIAGCKAGNKNCTSLILDQEQQNSPLIAPCDICCVESKFCRECCCILCYKIVDSAYSGYSFIMCNVKLGDNICGHVCHLECALRSYSAGTVGGTIGLDAEYFCWRCDGRTELISHANKLLQTCEAIDADEDGDIKEKILKLGICLVRGSEKAAAKELMSRMTLAMSKLKHDGTNTEDILNLDVKTTANSSGSSGNGNAAMDTTDDVEGPLKHLNVQKGTKSFHYQSELLKLDAEFDKAMEDLEKSQKYEYKLAEESLHTHKEYLLNISQQLDKEKSELAAGQSSTSHSSVLLQTVEERNEQLRQELKKFEEMKKVANGFGSTSKEILEKHFGL